MKKIATLVLLIGISLSLKSQDIHFSQFYASPMTLNPALTGMFNGDFRVAGIARGQWFSIPTAGAVSPYSTFGISYEHSLFRKKLKTHGLGVGFAASSDEAGDGSLTTQMLMGSLAYHLALDRYGRHRITLGLQGGMVFMRIFQHDLLFEEQWDSGLNTFNPLLYNGEGNNFEGNIMYPDFNAGLAFTSRTSDKFAFYLGFALNHVATPSQSFLGNDANKLGRRYVAHGGIQWKTSKYFKVLPTVLYMMQSEAQQLNVGSAFEYEFMENVFGYLGGYTRLVGKLDGGLDNDAVIFTIGMEVVNIRAGFSYDFNTSKLRGATKSVGAAELSVVYIHNKQNDGKIQYEQFCPNF